MSAAFVTTKKSLPPPVPRELALLLCCARTSLTDEDIARARKLLDGGMDWEYLLQTALRHGLLGLVYRHLAAIVPAGAIPAVYLNRMRDHCRSGTARNLLLTGELRRILNLFEQHGIAAMPYKGPALAAFIYGDVTLRPFADLDILVRERDVFRAHELLIAQGYEPHFSITGAQARAAFLRLGYVQLFERDRGKSLIELHWAIAPRFFSFPLDTEKLWERLIRIDLGEAASLPPPQQQVLAPRPEDLLLILCAHGVKDLWERLEWVCAIAELVRAHHQQMNWDQVEASAAELGSRRMLRLGLYLARELFQAPVPDEMWRDVASDPAVEPLAAQVCERLLSAGSAQQTPPSPPGLVERVCFHLRARERWRDRARYCARLAMTTTPVDWAFLPLPPSLSFVHLLLRPVRLARKYGLSPQKHL